MKILPELETYYEKSTHLKYCYDIMAEDAETKNTYFQYAYIILSALVTLILALEKFDVPNMSKDLFKIGALVLSFFVTIIPLLQKTKDFNARYKGTKEMGDKYQKLVDEIHEVSVKYEFLNARPPVRRDASYYNDYQRVIDSYNKIPSTPYIINRGTHSQANFRQRRDKEMSTSTKRPI